MVPYFDIMNNFFNFSDQYMNAVNIASLLIDLENQKLNSQDLSNSEAAKQTIDAVVQLQKENRDLSKKIIEQNETLIRLCTKIIEQNTKLIKDPK